MTTPTPAPALPADDNDLRAGAWAAPENKLAAQANDNKAVFSDLAMAISNQWGEAEEDQVKRKDLEYIYWKRCERERCFRHSDKLTGVNLQRGWVVTGPSEASDPRGFDRYVRAKHMTPLPQYGAFPIGEASIITGGRTRLIELVNRGGLLEVPLDQMIAYNWDKIPLLRMNVPALTGVNRWPCKYGCIGRDFTSQDGYKEHIKAIHENLMVQEATAETFKAAIEMLGDKLIAAQSAGTAIAPMDPTVMATTLALAMQMTEAAKQGQAQTAAEAAAAIRNPSPRSGKNAQAAPQVPAQAPTPDNVVELNQNEFTALGAGDIAPEQ